MFQDRVVPQEAITATEKENTLQRLNQVIQHRLVTGNLLPQMRNVKVGRNILLEIFENQRIALCCDCILFLCRLKEAG